MPEVPDRMATTIRKSLLALATVIPLLMTSCGRRLSARLTRFCTWTVAVSASVPLSKVREMFMLPLERDVELKYNRLSTLVSCCSMTEVTADSMTSALAPGYEASILTCGGAMGG